MLTYNTANTIHARRETAGSEGWGECSFIQDGQGNVVTSEQRPKGSEGRNLTEIWGKEHYRGKQQPVQRSWGGYTLDVFNKHERVLRRLGEQGG